LTPVSERKVKRRPLKKISIGDMNQRVSLFCRSIKGAAYNKASLSESYSKIADVWSKVESIGSGFQEFAGIDISQAATHIFVIRFRDDVTTETVIQFDGSNYEILNKDDPESRHEYLILTSRLKGKKELEASR